MNCRRKLVANITAEFVLRKGDMTIDTDFKMRKYRVVRLVGNARDQ